METVLDQMLISVRRIMRAADLHSNFIKRTSGLTSPQLLLLKAIKKSENASIGQLSEAICLSQATATTILDRLERAGFARRVRSEVDKRKVHVELTETGKAILEDAPPPLQPQFIDQFSELKEYDQTALLSSLQRIADLMDQEESDSEANKAA
ncbi:MAG: MarR family transcriptional regulator [Pseudomonadales bacterium]|jgi:DNA-binding MarR family transcriptional regulator|nr:MarR family transcriptional regulator [Pseudomonadales bacterium]